MDRLQLALKTLSQLGVGPLALYGLYRFGIRIGHYRRLDARMLRAAQRAAGPLLPVFALPEPNLLAGSLSRQAKAALLREANAVAAGKLRLFGGTLVPLHLAFRLPLRHWTEYESGTLQVPKSQVANPHAASDPKFAWEPARFGWAFTLGRAFHLSRREWYARAFWSHFERFDKSNPAYMGPHWMSGQEVAIRLMALIWSAQVFASARASTSRRLSRLARSIAQHAARIPPTLVYARSQNNNHLITESTALYLAGSTLDQRPWRDMGWHWLNRGLQMQIGSYGEYIQHSTNYHRLMLQSVLLADAVRRLRGEPWPAQTLEALSRASHWLFSMLDPASGRTPNLGANDGALILPLSSAPFGDFRPTVQAAARAFLRTGLPAGDWDELSLWLGLPETGHTADSAAYTAEHLRSNDSWAYLRASSFRSRLSHMDQLHLDLWWRGHNVVADAGTYLYNAPAPWDNPLVSSRLHNCVAIDGREQMTRGGRFLTLDWFPAYTEHVLSAAPPVLGQITAHHRGYEPLGVRHERTLSLLEGGRWNVMDDVLFTRRKAHLVRLHWLLLDGEWHLQHTGPETRLRLRVPGGWFRIVITASGFDASTSHVTLIRAGKILYGDGTVLPYEGWISPSYGRKEPALSLALEAKASNTCSFTTEFILPA